MLVIGLSPGGMFASRCCHAEFLIVAHIDALSGACAFRDPGRVQVLKGNDSLWFEYIIIGLFL